MTTEPSPFEGRSPVASTVSGGLVTLVEGQTFSLSGRTGDMSPDFTQGLVVLDTRVLSRWELRVNGHRVEPLTVDVPEPFDATFVARAFPGADRTDADVVVFRDRSIGSGMCERISLTNHGIEPVPVDVELRCDADFADLFEVKENRVPERARPDPVVADGELRFHSPAGGSGREVVVRSDVPAVLRVDRRGPHVALVWHALLQPGATWETLLTVTVALGGTALVPRFSPDASAPAEHRTRLASWRQVLPEVRTDDEGLANAVRRAGDDLGALRIFDPDHPDVPIVAAGAPWFMTVFGRDSLITAGMTLLADSTLARGVLETLARFQGTDVDPRTEEEPGRILHEIRFGGASGLTLGGGDIYYGSIDSTPLFVVLLAELRRWDHRDDLVDRLLPHADRALAWIDEFGDRDGDGFVEYQQATPSGLANQGWKDSWDAVRHADGELARGPIALCEVQAYVYGAYVARAHLAHEAGDHATHDRYRRKAAELRRRFDEAFWVDRLGGYAMALDGDKRPVEVLSSNMGHCLWLGFVEPEKAASVADRLLSPALFSGWGIRTLGAEERAFNPVSYHNGSVWPHDNAMCAEGLGRYGFTEAAHRVIEAQLDVSTNLGGRLPELFAGFERGRPASPAAYPTSCSPQAWAAAAPLLWLRTLLRLDPSAPEGEVWLQPRVPASIRSLEVRGIAIGGNRLTVRVEGDEVEVGLSGDGSLKVNREARPPVGMSRSYRSLD